MSLFGGGGGTVDQTGAERTLASNAMAQFQDYQSRWLPVQDHFANVVMDMGKPDSWQRQEAEGKGNEDVAASFAQNEARRTSQEMASGINVGSARFKMGVSGSAAAEAEARGLAITSGNESIDKAYLGNLTKIAQTGQQLATSSMQGQGIGGEVASRIALSSAQEQNQMNAMPYEAAGLGLSALASPQGQTQLGQLARQWGISGGGGGGGGGTQLTSAATNEAYGGAVG
jgi:hypothetical protein